MLLDPDDWSLASRIDDVLPALSRASPMPRARTRIVARSSWPAGVRYGDPADPALGLLVGALAADFAAGPREQVAVV